MNISFSKEQVKLRQKIREYLQDLMTPALRHELEADPNAGAEGGGSEFRKAMVRMGKDGWIGMGWDKELGGDGLTPLEQYIFTEEILRVRFPYPFLTTDGVGPVLARYGTDEMKDTVVKDIRGGKAIFAIGYSEPNAGTDLASLRTRAEQNDAGDWIINGQKTWTSLANFADYIWLAARTDVDINKRHKGLSIFVVPTDSKGYSVTPIYTLGGVRTNSTYYENISIPSCNLVGDINGGWKLITSQLNIERLSLVNHGYYEEMVTELEVWASKQRLADGSVLIEQPWVQSNFARLYTGLQALKLICWKLSWQMTEGQLGMAEASAAKVYGSEFFIELDRMVLEIAGEAGALVTGDADAVLDGRPERMYRTASILTFGGGANEIQRDIIGMAGLLLPRAQRG